ncbi:MAG TPA: GNAT family protein [Bdellovibrionales bacterium]|jgi:RimJ/RimL family protein N-acetyltransferase|nr:GNAT family protein [Bdellovibrionales bacterium]
MIQIFPTTPEKIQVPESIETPRLLIRPFRLDDVTEYQKAIAASYEALHRWIPWATSPVAPNFEETQKRVEFAMGRFNRREALDMIFLEKSSGDVLGALNLFCHDWKIPAFEIGYWMRTDVTGRGFGTEASLALSYLAFKGFGANRVHLRCDPLNVKSCAIPERLGFVIEGTLKNNYRAADGRLCETRIYARTSATGLPSLEVKW